MKSSFIVPRSFNTTRRWSTAYAVGTFDRRIGSKTGEIRVTHRVVACADIYTGVAAVQELPLWPTRDTAEFRRKVQALQDELRSRILEEMPLAQMKTLEDALLRYADFPARIVLTGGSNWGTLPVAYPVGDANFRSTNKGVDWFAEAARESGASPLAGDFNGDRRQDVALTGGADWTCIPVAFASDDGTFRPEKRTLEQFPALAQRDDVRPVAGDFNGDGKDDIALTGGADWTSVPIAFSNGDGTFKFIQRTVLDFPVYAAQGGKPVAGDFNGDGLDDIALTGPKWWGSVPVAFSLGNGTFRVVNHQVIDFPYYATLPGAKAVAGDFNGHGKDDIALTGGIGLASIPVATSVGDGTFWVTNGWAGGFAAKAAQPGARPVVADFNNDGQAERETCDS